jgi:hypothetical protein
MRQRQGFKRRTDLDDLLDRDLIKRSHPHSATWFADGQPLRPQELKGFSYWHMTGFELLCDPVLPKRSACHQRSGDNSLGKNLRNTLCRGFRHASVLS